MALKQGDKIGILGGGQLAQLLINAANKLGLKTLVFDPNEDSPAFNIATEFICEPFSNQKALESFSKKSDIVTYEFENIPLATIDIITPHCKVLPNREALKIGQNRLLEKGFINQLGINTARYSQISNKKELLEFCKLTASKSIIKKYKWSDIELEDIKKALYSITGRSTLPSYTHEFVTRIAYMMKQKKYYDLEDKEMYDGESIDVKYAKFFMNDKYTPLKHWKLHPDSKVCVDFTYKPAAESRFVTVDKKLMINIYEKNSLEPDSKVDTDIYWALVKHDIPHEDCRKHFLDWNAWIIQNKGKKIRHGIILQSDEFQLGKGSLYDVNRDILGRVNAKKIELEQALDKGKGYLVNSIMCLIDEAKSTGKWEEKQKLINTLKIIITEGSVGIRQLYKEYSESDTCTNYWINTNHRDAFALPPNEVRYWVYFSEAKRNEAMLTDYHNARFNHNLAAGVYAEMLDRDVSKFNPNGVAPHTIYRDMMTKLADKPVNDFVRDNFEQKVFPFDRDLVTTVELLDWLKKKPRVRVSRENDVATALKQIGGIKKRGCQVNGVGDNVTIWIINNHEIYKNLTASELGKRYIGFWTETRAD